MMQTAVTNNVDTLLKEINERIKQHKIDAKKVTQLLKTCENKRTQTINLIDEAQHNGLNSRIAGLLEDKLRRPYALSLFRM